MKRVFDDTRLPRFFFLYCVIEVVLCIAATIVLHESQFLDLHMAEITTGWISCLNLLLFVVASSRIKGSILSIAFLFVVFMYLFNLGIPIARLFGWVTASQELALARRVYSLGYQNYRDFSLYGFWLISLLQIGLLSGGKSVSSTSDNANSAGDCLYLRRLRLCRLIGLVLMVIGIIPFLSLEIATIRHAVAYGYHNTDFVFDTSGSGQGLVGGMFTVGFFFMLVGVHRNRKAFNCLFAAMACYQIARMFFTGDRSTGVMMVIVLVVARHVLVARIRGSRVLISIAAIYLGLAALKFIELTRTGTGLSAEAAFREVLQSNVFFETVGDYGTNIWNGLMVYCTVPSDGFFRCGLTYIAAIIGKPLQILGLADSVWRFADFSNFLKEPIHSHLISLLTESMGGSFSGEWYFNFGWFGLILIPFFGRLLAMFSDLCCSARDNPCVTAFALYTATLVLWWVRQYFTSVSWYVLFYGIVVCVIYGIARELSFPVRRTDGRL